MRRIIQISFLLMLSSLIWFGCGQPPVVYKNTVNNFNYTIAKADTLLEITASQVYDSLVRSREAELGGLVNQARVKAILDSMLCDTLQGLKAWDLNLDQYYRNFRW